VVDHASLHVERPDDDERRDGVVSDATARVRLPLFGSGPAKRRTKRGRPMLAQAHVEGRKRLGALLRETRRRLGLTIRDIAEGVGWAPTTLYELENGRMPCPGPRRAALAKVLGIDVALLKPATAEQLCSSPEREQGRRRSRRLRRERSALVLRARVRRRRWRLASIACRLRGRMLGPTWRACSPWSCPKTECRYHVPTAPGCALLFAARGAMTLNAVAQAVGITKQGTDQIIARAFARPAVAAWAKRLRDEGWADDLASSLKSPAGSSQSWEERRRA
jgi:transcriptional regulator with XRE-family HTH domain